jgi:hypothetical protein
MKRLVLVGLVLLGGCAYPISSTVESVDGKRAEFDYWIYLMGVACGSQESRHSETRKCPPTALRHLSARFAERSAFRPLGLYLSENGASCRAKGSQVTCDYETTVRSTPRVWGQMQNPAFTDRFELRLTFPVEDHGLRPEQIETSLKRFSRVN